MERSAVLQRAPAFGVVGGKLAGLTDVGLRAQLLQTLGVVFRQAQARSEFLQVSLADAVACLLYTSDAADDIALV